jgi:excinuclease ABC subunit C
MAVDVDELLGRVPTQPGVYLMKDDRGRVVYVGKAKDLRARVRQYFRPGGDSRFFVAAGLLRRALADIETLVVDNEKEALLLENHLIKQHQPRFNINLRDDKQYLVLRIDPASAYPRVDVVRNIKNDGARYFGPYHSATSCRETLRFLNRHFQLRTCTDHVLRTRGRVCLQYQIKRCPGPCVYPIDRAAYAEQVENVMLFLLGKKRELVPRLRAHMHQRAQAQHYESAAQLRDAIFAIEKSLAKQDVVQDAFVDQDVFGLFREGSSVEVAVLFVRQGKLMGRRSFFARDQEFPDDEVIASVVQQYYSLNGVVVPDEVVVPTALESASAISEWLTGLRGRRVRVVAPVRGKRVKLVALAGKNAAAAYTSRSRRDEDAQVALAKLQQRLELRTLPRRIECFDVAHIQGTAPVASRVVFVDGLPSRSEYRKFKLKEAQNDDFAAMYEVLTRRFRRALDDDERWTSPDLLVIDGGKGQLSSAIAAIEDLGIPVDFDVIGLAKERDDDKPERVYRRNAKEALRLRPNSAELHLLAQVRDEAHRFANTYHRQRRRKTSLRSLLDDISGIGPKRRQQLLRRFGSVKAIRGATVDDLLAVSGMSRAAAEAVYEFFRTRDGDGRAPDSAQGEPGPRPAQ